MNMRLTLLWLLGAVLPGQGTIPPVSATIDPAYWQNDLFYSAPGTTGNRVQFIYPSEDVSVPHHFTSIEFRRPWVEGTNPSITFDMKIVMSDSPVDWKRAKSEFSENHGLNKATVFDGPFSFPASTKGPSWPEPWLPAIPLIHRIVTPIKGGSLVVDFTITNQVSSGKSYTLEGHKPMVGTWEANGPPSCDFNSDGCNSSIYSMGVFDPYVGGGYYANWYNMPKDQPSISQSIMLIGTQGISGTAWGQQLPIPITSLGFQDSCTQSQGMLNQNVIAWLPMIYIPNPSGALCSGYVTIPVFSIPHIPSLTGANWFEQPLVVDKDNMIFMAQSIKLTMGSGLGPRGSIVTYPGLPNSLTGNFYYGFGLTMRLQ